MKWAAINLQELIRKVGLVSLGIPLTLLPSFLFARTLKSAVWLNHPSTIDFRLPYTPILIQRNGFMSVEGHDFLSIG